MGVKRLWGSAGRPQQPHCGVVIALMTPNARQKDQQLRLLRGLGAQRLNSAPASSPSASLDKHSSHRLPQATVTRPLLQGFLEER